MRRIGETVIKDGMEYEVYAILGKRTLLVGKPYDSRGRRQWFCGGSHVQVETAEVSVSMSAIGGGAGVAEIDS